MGLVGSAPLVCTPHPSKGKIYIVLLSWAMSVVSNSYGTGISLFWTIYFTMLGNIFRILAVLLLLSGLVVAQRYTTTNAVSKLGCDPCTD